MLVLKNTITLTAQAQTKTFSLLSLYPKETVSRIEGVTMRGRRFSHVQYRQWSYDATFDATDVVAEEAFFLALTLAASVEVTVTDQSNTARTKKCVLPNGDVAREYISGIINLPELKLTFQEIEPETA